MAVHPLIEKHADLVAAARAAATASPDATAAVELYDALAEAPWHNRPLPRRPHPQHLPSVTRILQTLGFRDPPGRWITEDDLARGRAVHLACQLDDEGTLDESTVDQRVAPFLAGFRKFKRENDSYRSCAWELQATHRRFGYTGRFDNVRFLRGVRALGDLKTNAADAATLHQLALYDLLIPYVDHPTKLICGDWFALVVMPDDYRIKQWSAQERQDARADVLAMVRTYHALARMRGR